VINWIATANSIKGIARPLLSRFRVVVPTEPTVRQRLHVAKEIARRVAQAYEMDAVPREIVVALADRTPREIRMALEAAASKVLRAGRSRMVERDVAELGLAAGQSGRRLAVQVH